MKTRRRVFGAVAVGCLWLVFLVAGGFFARPAFAESVGKEMIVNGGAEQHAG